MPIYAFRCADCGHAFDRLQKLADPDPAACPACGAAAVKRQLTAPSFRLAGSGWYETDFKKDGEKKRNLVEGGEGASKQADAGKPDSGKPEAGKSGGSGSDAATKPTPAATPAKAETRAKPAEKPAAAP